MKKLFLTTLMAAVAAFGYSQTPYWSYGFENGALTDAIGNDDLVQNGSALTTVNDRFSNTNDAVTLGGDHLVGGTTSAGSYSVSFWIKDAVNDANQRMVVNDYLNAYGYYIVLLNGNLRAYAKFGWTVNNQPYQASSAANLPTTVNVADGNWHHVVFTAREYQVGADFKFDFKIYIDGVLEGSDTRLVYMGSGTNRAHHGLSGSHTFAVGDNATNTYAFKYENTIDDIVFYKEDLTAAEVTAIYNERQAMTIYVDKDATGANDGSSWTDAFTSLKDATDYATVMGDEIWVADGTYTPDASSRTSSFRIFAGVSVYGGFNGTETALSQRDWRTNEVILSGDLSGNDNSNIDYSEATRSENSYRVVVIDGENTLIDGVTVSGGHGNHASDINYNRGSAIRKENDVNIMDVQNCIIENNAANMMAGIKAEFSSSSNHSVNIENCIFRNNSSRYGTSFTIEAIGGTTDAVVANCLMENNSAINQASGTGFSGSAGFFDSRVGSTLNASIINCTVADNTDSGTGVGNEPAPIAIRRYDGILNFTAVNCAFDGNSAAKSFGRLNSVNCPTSVTLSNNIRPDVATPFCSATSTNESSVGLNLDANHRPVSGSSSIDAGDNAAAVGTEDIDGNARILGGTIDIGAFEFDATACSPITQQPTDADFCVGDDVTLSVSTTGTITSYQWKKGGTNISGANAATLTLTNAQSGDAGVYTVEVVAACGTAVSSAATLTLNTATPTITTQPLNTTGCESDDVLVSVGATGAGLTYQWQKDGVDISGETSPSIFFDGIDASEAGNYTVVVSGTGLCPITSDVAVVTVNEAPTITQQPTDQLGCLGDNVTFTAAANGATVTQWYKNNAPMSGELASTLSLTNLVAGDVATYKMIASNSCGALFTDEVDLNIGATTAITTQPQGAAQCEATTASFNLIATGTNLSYQWQLDGQDLSGQTFQNLQVNGLSQADEGDYTCIVTGGCGVETSNAATLIVKDPAAITTTVSDFTECEGEDVTFSVGATGDDLTYAWIDQNGYISGETTSTLELTNVQLADAGSYTVEVAGACGATVADAGDLTVSATTAISSQPTDETGCAGDPVSLSVTATGDNLSYQWKKGGTPISGANAASYSIASPTVWEAGDYTVTVSGTCGNETSSVATLTINEVTSITTQPSDLTECEGENVSFSVAADGASLTYQWSFEGSVLAGETASTLDVSGVAMADAGDYTVEVSGACGSETSSVAVLTVNALPQPVITENMGMLETGVFDTYQWYIDGNIQNGETSASIAVTVSGDYTVEVTENGCEGTSSPYNVMTVGIEEQAASIVAAYPNPFENVVNVELADFAGQTEITVVDMTGRTVLTSIETASKIQLNLEHLSTGTYGLVVRGEDGKTAMSRLIKN